MPVTSTAEIDAPGRRLITLFATWETNEALHAWCKDFGFDLGWSHSGWPQSSDAFGFHVTVVASTNSVSVPVGYTRIDPLTLTPTGFAAFGEAGDTPVMGLAADANLAAIRDFFVKTFGVEPTYPDFKPHVSLSYKWAGSPGLEGLPLPGFPLVFDALIVTERADKPTMSADAARGEQTTMTGNDAAAAAIKGTRRTADGYLVTEARCARTGIQDYAGYEVGKPEMGIVKVYRPESEVFSRDALASYAHRPVTVGHPEDGVCADNWKAEAVGHTGGEIARDGELVKVSLVVMDAAAIQAVEDGIREISMGYMCRLDWTPGVTADGEKYDAVQRDLRMNHLALVEKGRAGAACKVGDGAAPMTGADKMETSNMVKLTVDGIGYELTDQAAELVKKLQADNTTKATALAAAETALVAGIKAKDTAIGERDAMASKVPTADQLDALVLERSTVGDAAKTLLPDIVTAGKTLDAIRAEVVKAKLGDAAVAGRSADYVAAAFDTLTTSAASRDPVADHFRDGGNTATAKVSARDKHLAEQRDAWKGKAA